MKSLLTLFILGCLARASVTECFSERFLTHGLVQADWGSGPTEIGEGRRLSGSFFGRMVDSLNPFKEEKKGSLEDPSSVLFEATWGLTPQAGTRSGDAYFFLCLPALDRAGLKATASFLCASLLKQREGSYAHESLDYLLEHSESAYARLSKILRAALRGSFEDSGELFTERLSGFERRLEGEAPAFESREQLLEEANGLAMRFKRSFDHSFEKFGLELNRGTHEAFQAVAGSSLAPPQTKERTNWLLGTLSDEDLPHWASKLKALVGGRTLSLEDPAGAGVYPYLADLLSSDSDSNTNLIGLKLRRTCHKALFSLYNFASYGKCEALISAIASDPEIREELGFFRESHSFLTLLQDTAKASIAENMNELSTLETEVLRGIKEWLRTVRKPLEERFSGEFSKETASFFFDLGEAATLPAFGEILAKDNVLGQLKAHLQEYFYASQKFEVEWRDQSEAAENLSGKDNSFRLNELHEKLRAACRVSFRAQQQQVCVSSLLRMDLDGFLAQRHGSILADLLVEHFSAITKNTSFDLNDLDTLEEEYSRKMQEIADELLARVHFNEAYFAELPEKKSKMLFLAAFHLSQILGVSVSEESLPFFDQKARESLKVFQDNKIKSEAFQARLGEIIRQGREQFGASSLHKQLTQEPIVENAIRKPSSKLTRNNVQGLVQGFDFLGDSLKESLLYCAPNDSQLKSELQACEEEFGKPCRLKNPFLLETACPKGSQIGPDSKCRLFCPEGFVGEEASYCVKPEVSIVDLETGECPHHHVLEIVLCVPQCPLGWIDDGRTCERPVTDHAQLKFLA